MTGATTGADSSARPRRSSSAAASGSEEAPGSIGSLHAAGVSNSTLVKPAARSFSCICAGSKKLNHGSPACAARSATARGASLADANVSTISLPAGNSATERSTASIASSRRYMVTPSQEKNVRSAARSRAASSPSRSDSRSKSMVAKPGVRRHQRAPPPRDASASAPASRRDRLRGCAGSRAHGGCRTANVSKPAPRMTYCVTPRSDSGSEAILGETRPQHHVGAQGATLRRLRALPRIPGSAARRRGRARRPPRDLRESAAVDPATDAPRACMRSRARCGSLSSATCASLPALNCARKAPYCARMRLSRRFLSLSHCWRSSTSTSVCGCCRPCLSARPGHVVGWLALLASCLMMPLAVFARAARDPGMVRPVRVDRPDDDGAVLLALRLHAAA